MRTATFNIITIRDGGLNFLVTFSDPLAYDLSSKTAVFEIGDSTTGEIAFSIDSDETEITIDAVAGTITVDLDETSLGPELYSLLTDTSYCYGLSIGYTAGDVDYRIQGSYSIVKSCGQTGLINGGTNSATVTLGDLNATVTLTGPASTITEWGDINGTLSSQTDLQAALDAKEPTKDADDNYVTDAEKTVIGNTSGTNTGDQDLSSYLTTVTSDETLTGSGTVASPLSNTGGAENITDAGTPADLSTVTADLSTEDSTKFGLMDGYTVTLATTGWVAGDQTHVFSVLSGGTTCSLAWPSWWKKMGSTDPVYDAGKLIDFWVRSNDGGLTVYYGVVNEE